MLAPLATLTHAGFRILVHELGGCDLYWNEMISASAYLGGASYEEYYTRTDPDPTRLVHQVVGSTVEEITACAEGLVEECRAAGSDGPFGIDVNMGCSAPQIVRRGGGIAWMRQPERAAELVRRLRQRLPDTRLSAKLRLGDTDDPEFLLGFAKRLADAGLDWITLHPKTRKDGAHRPANWRHVGALSTALSIPVVGNGNVVDAESCGRKIAMAESAAGVMIGRGAAQKPWIFAELRGGSVEEGERKTVRDVDVRFRELLAEHQPPVFHQTRARRFYNYFSANFTYGYRLGAQIQNLRSYQAIVDHMDRYYDSHPHEAEVGVPVLREADRRGASVLGSIAAGAPDAGARDAGAFHGPGATP